MKNKLVIITAVLILMISNIFSIKANAAESMASGTWTYNGNEYIFYKYQGDVTYTSSSAVLTFHLTEPTYIINTSGGLVFASRTQYTVVYDETKLSTGVTYPSNGSYPLLNKSSGNTVFCTGISGYYIDNIPITDLSLKDATMRAFANFIESDSFKEPVVTPDISDLEEDTSLNLVGFTADNNVNVSWTGLSNQLYANSESYAVVEFMYGEEGTDKTTGWEMYSGTFPLMDNGFVLPWNDIQKDSYILQYLSVTPIGANIDSDTVFYLKGNSSMIIFNDDGSISDIVTTVDTSYVESGTYSAAIPTPEIVMDSENYTYVFEFNNASDNYFIELQGRWYTVDDIELYKESAMWKYKYNTILKSSLSDWISTDLPTSAVGHFDLAVVGNNAFNELLLQYPVTSRSYSGGTNSVGNFFSGYDDALETIQMLLGSPYSIYNGVEIYARFYTVENGQIHYGKWCHWYDALANAGGSSGSTWDDKDNMFTEYQSSTGISSSEKDALENSGNSKSDTDVISNYINNTSTEIATEKVWTVMSDMVSAMGDFPLLISTVISWLPHWLVALIAASIGLIIILRFLGR